GDRVPDYAAGGAADAGGIGDALNRPGSAATTPLLGCRPRYFSSSQRLATDQRGMANVHCKRGLARFRSVTVGALGVGICASCAFTALAAGIGGRRSASSLPLETAATQPATTRRAVWVGPADGAGSGQTLTDARLDRALDAIWKLREVRQYQR